MKSMLPVITVSKLQRSTKDALAGIRDYAVVQSHGKDVALILNPLLGKALLESGKMQELLKACAEEEGERKRKAGKKINMNDLDRLIGNVILELSKK